VAEKAAAAKVEDEPVKEEKQAAVEEPKVNGNHVEVAELI